jgi:hypothetical protein
MLFPKLTISLAAHRYTNCTASGCEYRLRMTVRFPRIEGAPFR